MLPTPLGHRVEKGLPERPVTLSIWLGDQGQHRPARPCPKGDKDKPVRRLRFKQTCQAPLYEQSGLRGLTLGEHNFASFL